MDEGIWLTQKIWHGTPTSVVSHIRQDTAALTEKASDNTTCTQCQS